jgi:hypothetical protein
LIFLLEYSRSKGRIVGNVEEFDEADRAIATAKRLARELELHREGVIDHEVVLLEAQTLETLRHTHGRYFFTAEELFQRLMSSLDGKSATR